MSDHYTGYAHAYVSLSQAGFPGFLHDRREDGVRGEIGVVIHTTPKGHWREIAVEVGALPLGWDSMHPTDAEKAMIHHAIEEWAPVTIQALTDALDYDIKKGPPLLLGSTSRKALKRAWRLLLAGGQVTIDGYHYKHCGEGGSFRSFVSAVEKKANAPRREP